MKQTQCKAILAYLRKHKTATNMELIRSCGSVCPWKRIEDAAWNYYKSALPAVAIWRELPGWDRGRISKRERVARYFIKTPSGKRVVQYRLERV